MQGGVDSAAGALGKTGKRPSQFIALLATRAVQKLRWRPSVTWSISLRRVDSLRAPEPRAHVFTPVPPSHAALDVDFHRESVELQMSVINPFLGGSVAESVLMPPTSCGMGRGWLRAAIRALEELYPTKLAEVVPAHQTKHELTYGPRSPYLASA